jgi:hypothetical protein
MTLSDILTEVSSVYLNHLRPRLRNVSTYETSLLTKRLYYGDRSYLR